MDERRTIPLEPDVKIALSRRRGTPLWKQLLVSLVVLVVAAAGWLAFRAEDRARLLSVFGIQTQTAEAQPQAQAAGQGQQPQQGQQPGGGNVRPGGGGGNFPGGGRRNQTAVVVTAPVGSAVINDKLMAIGEGTAARSATVTSASGGTLVSLSVKPGDVVEANTVIGQLDAQSEQIAYDRASLASKDAQDTLARTTELVKSKSISAVQLAAAQLAADQAALELRNAELALNKRRIMTPIGGTVGLLQVNVGNLVNAQSVVTTVEDSSEILVNFWVPERYASSIKTGMPVEALAVALPGQTFAGMVSAVDNKIDPASRTLQVQAKLPNPDGLIQPGMSFQVTMGFPGDTFPTVDPLAIQWSADGAYVWKYVDGKVQQANVKIVERNSGGILVTGDVAMGDQVVTQGVLQLTAGQTVRLLDDSGVPAQGQGSGQQQGQNAAQGNGQGATAPPAEGQGQGQTQQTGQHRKQGQGNGQQAQPQAPQTGGQG